MTCTVIAIAHHAGGVGKTTTALNLAAELAATGARVCGVDLDPQADWTQRLGAASQAPHTALATALLHGGTPDAVGVGGWTTDSGSYFRLVPSDRETMAVVELGLMALPHREQRLAEALAPLQTQYDYILLDCPPALNLLSLNALYAADYVLITVQAQDKAVRQLAPFLTTLMGVQLWRAKTPPYTALPAVLGYLLTMIDDTRQARSAEADLREVYGGEVFTATIPRRTALADDGRWARPIAFYDPTNAAAVAYSALAQEVITRAQTA